MYPSLYIYTYMYTYIDMCIFLSASICEERISNPTIHIYICIFSICIHIERPVYFKFAYLLVCLFAAEWGPNKISLAGRDNILSRCW